MCCRCKKCRLKLFCSQIFALYRLIDRSTSGCPNFQLPQSRARWFSKNLKFILPYHGVHECLVIYHVKLLFCTLCHIYHQGWVIIWRLKAEESVGSCDKGRCSSINSDLESHHCIVSFHPILYKQSTSQLLKSEHL